MCMLVLHEQAVRPAFAARRLQRPRAQHWGLRAVARQATVYLVALPLVGLEAVDPVLPRAAAAHRALAVEDPAGGFTLWDFLPVSPTAPATAAQLLAGGAVAAERVTVGSACIDNLACSRQRRAGCHAAAAPCTAATQASCIHWHHTAGQGLLHGAQALLSLFVTCVCVQEAPDPALYAQAWDCRLRLRSNDCSTFAHALAAHLLQQPVSFDALAWQ